VRIGVAPAEALGDPRRRTLDTPERAVELLTMGSGAPVTVVTHGLGSSIPES
jgi:hypothetical protein